MLYRVIISNFTSFADDCEFNMFPNPKRETFSNHVYKDGVAMPVLKSSALYGANGSGKTNFIEALREFRRFAINFKQEDNNNEVQSAWYKANRFRLPVVDETKPMGFLAEFEHKGKPYIYIIEIDADGIKTEKLLHPSPGKKKNAAIFSRNGKEVDFCGMRISEEVKKIFKRQIDRNRFYTLLSLNGGLCLLDDEDMDNAYRWFKDSLEVVQVNRMASGLINVLHDNEKLKNFISEAFSQVDLGLKGIEIRERDMEEVGIKDLMENIIGQKRLSLLDKDPRRSLALYSRDITDVPSLSLAKVDGRTVIRDLLFSQFGKDDYVGDMELESQSMGTQRLLSLMPALYDAIYTSRTVVIDEIENSIHPMLIRRLIQLFGDAPSKGQLIYSTHETSLLDQQELLRPDEVWLIEKSQGCSHMYSLNDFKIHNTLSLEKGYLDGRFGAIPFIGDLKILVDGTDGTEVQ